ncbi:MAG: outer membrane beta-barrel protein [Pseudomonadota bacterium]|nr:outer membrane beta-barrel protein [Pseudomonadota bacterium]
MLRLLFPTTLALLLLPSVAIAAPAPAVPDLAVDGPLSADTSALSQAPDQAERSMRRSRSGGSSKGDSKKGDSKKGDSKRDDGGSRSSESSRGESSRGESRDSGSGERRDDGPTAQPRSAPAPRPEGDREGGREGTDTGGRSARPAPYGSEGGSSRPDDARPAGASSEGRERTVRTFDGSRPAPTAASTRRVSTGAPASASSRTGSGGEMRASAGAPANFRGVSSSRTAVSGHGESGRGESGRGESGRGEARDAGRDGHDTAERHGARGSDAERATYSSRGEAGRHHEEVRHARSTAAYHRSSAAYHRSSAAARHHAWSSSRYGRGDRWYRPGGWFRPYRPGHAYWYHGVFVYGPSPGHRHAVDNRGGERGSASEAPVRKVERARTFAVGIRGGSYMGGYSQGGSNAFGDAGLGIAARYRPVEAVGLEVSWMHHDQTWEDGSERVYQPLQASVQLFGMPWTKVNPYVLAGVTITGRDVQDNLGFTTVSQDSTLWGPHGGVGLELGVGKKASINFDVRYTGYLNKPANDLTVPGAVQGNMGLNFYF